MLAIDDGDNGSFGVADNRSDAVVVEFKRRFWSRETIANSLTVAEDAAVRFRESGSAICDGLADSEVAGEVIIDGLFVNVTIELRFGTLNAIAFDENSGAEMNRLDGAVKKRITWFD